MDGDYQKIMVLFYQARWKCAPSIIWWTYGVNQSISIKSLQSQSPRRDRCWQRYNILHGKNYLIQIIKLIYSQTNLQILNIFRSSVHVQKKTTQNRFYNIIKINFKFKCFFVFKKLIGMWFFYIAFINITFDDTKLDSFR